jgi:protein-S-isoprenylcysteine O-methyltransferase Ste14
MSLVKFRNSRAWDLVAALPLVGLSVFGAAGFAILVFRQWPLSHDAITLLVIISEACSAAFLMFQATLLLVRRLPVAKADGLAPRIWAFIGANFALVIVLTPKAALTPALTIASSSLISLGTVGAIFTLRALGRSFSVFPQARKLVTSGPYRAIRHPLYVAEQVSAFGLALQYRQPWGLLIVSIALLLQFPRMRYEETVLEATYEAYSDYKKRTARLIPFLL